MLPKWMKLEEQYAERNKAATKRHMDGDFQGLWGLVGRAVAVQSSVWQDEKSPKTCCTRRHMYCTISTYNLLRW